MGFPDSSVSKESACNAGHPSLIPGSGRSAGERIGYPFQYSLAFLVAQLVKNPPALQETWVRSLGCEDPLEKERLPTPVSWPGEFHGPYSPWSCKELDTTQRLSLLGHIPSSGIAGSYGNFIPSFCKKWSQSCLEAWCYYLLTIACRRVITTG